MFNFKTFLFGEKKNMFTITNNNNRFFITDRHGVVFGNTNGYSRKRDANRGAERANIQLAA